MRLSWNEIRARASVFATEWQDAAYEKGETQSFYNEFFEVFGVRRRTVARYEEHVAKLDNRSGFIDLFWPSVLIVEQKSAGRDLGKAYDQAGKYFDALPERDRPRYILVSDFQTFELHDLDERRKVAFALEDLPDHVEHFGFILGIQRRTFRDQDPANIKAAELVGRLHDALDEAGYRGHDLECFLVRTVFCLFADDTGIFEPRDIFLDFIETRTSVDGADLGPLLSQLFQVLDTPEVDRTATLDEDLVRFPYINGDLFNGPLRIPAFNTSMREALLDACRFDWTNISPAIFGALFQSVMDPDDRRAQGAHYTTEKNILKVIEPLFMDDLRAEFVRLKNRKDSRRLAELRRFRQRIGEMRFFDPACGCGNFLIIAYRELRTLEIDVLKELNPHGQQDLIPDILSLITVDQFYGIELGEFPARIAETAMWMMDHIMNNRLSLEFGQIYVRIPLRTSPHIMHGDALETEWSELLPPEACTFVFGNPPFVGAKLQTAVQRAQVRRIAALGKTGGTLDYVQGYFMLEPERGVCDSPTDWGWPFLGLNGWGTCGLAKGGRACGQCAVFHCRWDAAGGAWACLRWAGGTSVRQEDGVEGFLAPHHEVQVGFGDMVEAAMENDGQHDVVERGVVGGAMAGADAAGVLAETHVAPIVVAVLDLPVAAVPGEQPFGVRPVLWNGGDAESGLFTGFAGFQVGALAGDAEHLLSLVEGERARR